jgi:hypothetical protein
MVIDDTALARRGRLGGAAAKRSRSNAGTAALDRAAVEG